MCIGWIIIIFGVLARIEALQVLTTSPEGDVLVAMNHTNTAVEFTCHVEGGEPYWELAMHQLPKEFNESGIVVKSNATHSFLTISPNAINTIFKGDNITVRCIAFRHNPFQSVPGKFSHIIRYGPPSSPTGVYLSPFSFPPVLTWKRPVEMPAEVSVTYTVIVTNLKKQKIILHRNISRQSVDIVVPEDAECEPHSITVRAWNEVGQSEAVTLHESIPISPNISNVIETLTVNKVNLKNESVTANIEFKGATVCNDKYPLRNYTILVDELPGSLTLSPGNVSNRVSLTTEVLPGLVANKVFTVRVKTCNDITCKTSQPVQLSTHYLRSASVAYTNSSTHVLLRCRYTNGSSVMGCLFIFKFNNTLTKSFNVSLEESTGHCAILSGAAYGSVSVYGVDSNGQMVGRPVMANRTEVNYLHQCSPAQTPTMSSNEIAIRVTIGAIGVTLSVAVVITVVLLIFCGWYWCYNRRKSYHEETDSSHLVMITDCGATSSTKFTVHILPETEPIDGGHYKGMVQLGSICKTNHKSVELKFGTSTLRNLPEENALLYYRSSQ